MMLQSLVAPFINFAVLVTILVFAMRKPLKEMVRDRHATLKDKLEATQRELAAAQKKFEEYSLKLRSLESELTDYRKGVVEDAEAMKVRIVHEAKKMADQIVIDAKKTSEAMGTEFKEKMRAELAQSVLARAENIIRSRLSDGDRERIRKDFSKQVETSR